MKLKLIVFRLTIVSILLLTTIIYSAAVTISKPTDNQTITIPSGTSISVLFEWEYVIDPGTTTWSFSTNTDGNWSDYSTDLSKTIDNVGVGTYTWKVRMQVLKDGVYSYPEDQVSFTVALGNYSITADNIFGGGQIKVGINTTVTIRTAPYNFSVYTNDVVYLDAIENQSSGGYTYIWNDTEAPLNKSKWRKKDNNNNYYFFSYLQSDNFTVTSNDDGYTYEAGLRKKCNFTFTNTFGGISETGTLEVNSATVSAPTAQYQVVEGNTIQVEAPVQYHDDVRYTFKQWSDGDTNKTRTITAGSHANLTASYIGTPQYTNLNLSFNSYNRHVQQYIKLTWTEHPNPGVTKYYVWRNLKNQTPVKIATVNRGTTTYTDIDYYISNSSSGTSLYYGIQAVFTPDNTVSNYSTLPAYGESAVASKLADTDSVSIKSPKVEEYALNSNYPNPFWQSHP